MHFFKQKIIVLLGVINCFMNFELCYSIPHYARDKGFIYLSEVDPTILVSLRYCTDENFVGKMVDGYKKPVVILMRQAAEALKKVQEAVKKDGYCLVVYDAYRPQQAVNNFVRWSADSADISKKNQYYPRVAKDQVFDLGYVRKRSGHSRGSRIDLTIIKDGESLHGIEEKDRKLLDGYTIKFLDDGTVDMGSSFDLFDLASHSQTNLIEKKFQDRRNYLKSIMEQHGFKCYYYEWWHFNLRNEHFPADKDENYFDFLVE